MMKPGLLFQILNALVRDRSGSVRPWSLYEEPKRLPSADEGGPPPAWLKRTRPYDDTQKKAVWQKGQPIVGWDPDDWRVDHRGNPMFRSHYGDRSSAFGWEVGFVVEKVRGGSEELSNLRPQRCRERRETDVALGTPASLDPYSR